jgi:poly(A) polymerase
LIQREREAGVAANPIRRLAALLPPDPELAERVAARLRLSKKQTHRLASACNSEVAPPHRLAYRNGPEEAVDRLLLRDGGLGGLRELQSWHRPRLPVRGGDLVKAGIEAGPEVARLLRRIEEQWVDEEFPPASRVRAIMEEVLAKR